MDEIKILEINNDFKNVLVFGENNLFSSTLSHDVVASEIAKRYPNLSYSAIRFIDLFF